MGGEVVVVMMAVLQAISGIGSAFSSIIELTKARVAAAFFLEVIDHKDEMVDTKAGSPSRQSRAAKSSWRMLATSVNTTQIFRSVRFIGGRPSYSNPSVAASPLVAHQAR